MAEKETHSVKTFPKWVTPVVIAAVCLIIYYPTLSIGFLSDDFLIVNEIIHGSISDIGSKGIFFRPLVIISFALDWYLFGDKPFAFHLVNVLMHIAASIGVAACASLLLRKPYAALIAGLIFALHPIHPEAVSWIAGRYDVLCGALLAWSLYAYLRSYTADAGKPALYLVLSYILFGLACLSKEMAYAFPLVILICGPPMINNTGVTSRDRLKRVAPFFIIAAILFILRYIRLGGIGGGDHFQWVEVGMPIYEILYRIYLQPFVILILPLNRFILQPTTSPLVITIQVILLLPLLMLLRIRDWRFVGFSAIAIFLSYLPASFLGVEGTKLMSSRFLYTPSIFYSIMFAGLLLGNGKLDWHKSLIKIMTMVYLTAMVLLLFQNNFPWQEAGRMTRSATASTDKLVDKYSGKWGVDYHRLLIEHVPRGYMGAYVFENGLPDMLHMRHGDALDGVEIEVSHQDAVLGEVFRDIETAFGTGAIVWGFDHENWVFVEYQSSKGEVHD